MIPTTAAVDLGGSWLRLSVSFPNGRLLSLKMKSVPPQQLPQVLRKIWTQKKWARVTRLIIGSKGIWTAKERANLARKLCGLAPHVTVMSDVELALHTAFPPSSKRFHRVFLIAGTGSIAIGFDPAGKLSRAGGLGPPNGDKGSGWWMGREFHKGGTLSRNSPGTVRQTAALAKRVIAMAPRNRRCAEIVREAQAHLADLVLDLCKKWKKETTVFLSGGGSLLASETFRKGVFTRARKKINHRIRIVDAPTNTARAAVRTPNQIPHGLLFIPPRLLTKK